MLRGPTRRADVPNSDGSSVADVTRTPGQGGAGECSRRWDGSRAGHRRAWSYSGERGSEFTEYQNRYLHFNLVSGLRVGRKAEEDDPGYPIVNTGGPDTVNKMCRGFVGHCNTSKNDSVGAA